MSAKRRGSAQIKTSNATRASITFPPDIYRVLEKIARQKKVSIAWVVRDAVEQYVREQRPFSETTP